MRTILAITFGALLLAGCREDRIVGPHDAAPAAPRGVYSVTGDGAATLHWLANTEDDVIGYRIYAGDCAGGPQCPYDRVGATSATSFVVTGLVNGRTRYFAVSAVDAAGNESDLSYDTTFDTPRPAGSGLVLASDRVDSLHAGYDFSQFAVVSYSSPVVDVYYDGSAAGQTMIAPFTDTQIQDAGFATTLDAVDFAPSAGWSPTGTVPLIPGHCYVVWTGDDHYAKFRVTSLTASQVVLDWAYQTDPGNPELRSRPEHASPRIHRTLAAAGALASARR